jgi:DNA-binding GntR family transcriptional regulator
MKPIKSTSFTDQVYEMLRQEIIGRRLKPNHKLDINSLAEETGVSRSPVVEALMRLEGEGLVIRRNRVGTFVAPLDRAVYEETLEARHMIEQFVTPLSIARMTEDLITELEGILCLTDALLQDADDDDSFDYDSFTLHDQDFHVKLVEACGNHHIIDFYRSLNAHMQIARVYARRALVRATEGHAEHERSLAAFKAQDVEGARRTQGEHLQRSRDGIMAMIEEHGIL